MSDDKIELPPEHIVGPGIYQVVLYDPATRTRFTLQIVSYHDFPAPVQRRMGFLRDIMIEPMSEAEVANFFGVPPDDPAVVGDGAAGNQLTPEQVKQLRLELAKAEEESPDPIDEDIEIELAAQERIEEIRRQIIRDKEAELAELKDEED